MENLTLFFLKSNLAQTQNYVFLVITLISGLLMLSSFVVMALRWLKELFRSQFKTSFISYATLRLKKPSSAKTSSWPVPSLISSKQSASPAEENAAETSKINATMSKPQKASLQAFVTFNVIDMRHFLLLVLFSVFTSLSTLLFAWAYAVEQIRLLGFLTGIFVCAIMFIIFIQALIRGLFEWFG